MLNATARSTRRCVADRPKPETTRPRLPVRALLVTVLAAAVLVRLLTGAAMGPSDALLAVGILTFLLSGALRRTAKDSDEHASWFEVLEDGDSRYK